MKTINIESQLTIQIATRQILPAAFRYQAIVADAVSKLKAAGAKVPTSQTHAARRGFDDDRGTPDRDRHPG